MREWKVIVLNNKSAHDWQVLDMINAPTRDEAIEKWKLENPRKDQTLRELNMRITALMEGGGI